MKEKYNETMQSQYKEQESEVEALEKGKKTKATTESEINYSAHNML